MNSRTHALRALIEEERGLLTYLANPHDGHAYAEDLIDAVALLTSWVMVGMSAVLVVGVLLDGLVR